MRVWYGDYVTMLCVLYSFVNAAGYVRTNKLYCPGKDLFIIQQCVGCNLRISKATMKPRLSDPGEIN